MKYEDIFLQRILGDSDDSDDDSNLSETVTYQMTLVKLRISLDAGSTEIPVYLENGSR